MLGVMTTNMYGYPSPGSRYMGMVLRNLSAQEVQIPPEMVTGKVQAPEKVPDRELLSCTGEDLPLKE